ncbi:MAG: metal-dependent hydrolase [Planctomycetota bacterium]|nr:metal-dependent hydrolase [Planctomycetota bacterium]
MDPLTHILLGATTAQFTARRRVGRDATWVAAVAGDLADVDVVFPTLVAFAGGDPTSLPRWMAHRGLTHSLFMAPVLALAAATIWWLARRAILRSRANGSSALSPSPPEPGFAWLFWATFVAALTHPLLDYCTSYGTQLLSPFSSQRFAADAIGIIDILFTSVLALTLPVCWLVRRRRPGGKAPGRIALAAYLGTGRLVHDRAIDKALAAIGNEPVVSAEAYPAIGSIFLWRTVVETPTHWHVARVHFLAPAIRQVRLARPVEKPLEDQWHALALAAPQAVEFAWFSGRPMRWEPRSRNGQHVVAFHDMRYAWPLDGVDGLWNLEVTLDNAGNVVTAQRAQPVPTGGRRRMFREVWQELWNP